MHSKVEVMHKVTMRELNQNTAAVLRLVTENEDLVVTECGVPKWRITAYRDDSIVLTRLERQGRYTPPSDNPAPWPSHPGGVKYSAVDIEELLDEMRGDQ